MNDTKQKRAQPVRAAPGASLPAFFGGLLGGLVGVAGAYFLGPGHHPESASFGSVGEAAASTDRISLIVVFGALAGIALGSALALKVRRLPRAGLTGFYTAGLSLGVLGLFLAFAPSDGAASEWVLVLAPLFCTTPLAAVRLLDIHSPHLPQRGVAVLLGLITALGVVGFAWAVVPRDGDSCDPKGSRLQQLRADPAFQASVEGTTEVSTDPQEAYADQDGGCHGAALTQRVEFDGDLGRALANYDRALRAAAWKEANPGNTTDQARTYRKEFDGWTARLDIYFGFGVPTGQLQLSGFAPPAAPQT